MKYAIMIFLVLLPVTVSSQETRIWMTGFENIHPIAGGYASNSNSPDGFDLLSYGGYSHLASLPNPHGGEYYAVFDGSYNLSFPQSRNQAAVGCFGNTTGPWYVNYWIYVPAISYRPQAAHSNLLKIDNNAFTKGVSLQWRTDGKWSLAVNGVIQQTSVDTLQRDVWLLAQLSTTWGAVDATSTIKFNGETLTTSAAIEAISSTSPFYLGVGWGDPPGDNFNEPIKYYGDDLIASTGQQPDTSERVNFGFSLADVNLDGWLNGASGSTNLFDGVNNNPVDGNTSESATTNIKNSISSITDNYDATAESYTASGLPVGKVVKWVQAIMRTAEHAAAGTESIAVKMVSNPSSDERVYAAGADLGAHGNENAGTGCVPGNSCGSLKWVTGRSPFVQNPAIDAGTGPVLRVERRTTNTNQVDVDLLGYQYSYATPSTQPGGVILEGMRYQPPESPVFASIPARVILIK